MPDRPAYIKKPKPTSYLMTHEHFVLRIIKKTNMCPHYFYSTLYWKSRQGYQEKESQGIPTDKEVKIFLFTDTIIMEIQRIYQKVTRINKLSKIKRYMINTFKNQLYTVVKIKN